LRKLPKQFEDTAASSSEVKRIVADQIAPILDKLQEVVDRLEKYHNHDVEFQQKFIFMLSRMLGNQEISMEAFDKFDSFLREEFFWNKGSAKKTDKES